MISNGAYFQVKLKTLASKVIITENEEDLRQILKATEETFINELNIKINTKNTNVLVFNRINYTKIGKQ